MSTAAEKEKALAEILADAMKANAVDFVEWLDSRPYEFGTMTADRYDIWLAEQQEGSNGSRHDVS